MSQEILRQIKGLVSNENDLIVDGKTIDIRELLKGWDGKVVKITAERVPR